MGKKAVILAGGKGTRLKPYTLVLPKPLMPLGEYPILEVIIKQLANHDFKEITLAVNHQANLIKAFFGDGSQWGVNIDYSLEETPLGTMGPLKLLSDLPQDFLVMNGDILTNLNYSHFYQNHIENSSLFSISSTKRFLHSDYGVLHETGRVLTGFEEKPVFACKVSMGIYMLNKKVLDFIPDGRPFGFDHLMSALLAKQQKVRVNEFEGHWLDIGREEDYRKAVEEFEFIKNTFLP